ncbi:hypothetical protein ACNQ05_25305, partial [Enterobacter cloacae complex sp.6701062]|uniref:hypothetical protein n=1 Tax=Enterobacter cloacae complex sp.6701062 TaxID=3397177 RepID=UPI003AB01BAD
GNELYIKDLLGELSLSPFVFTKVVESLNIDLKEIHQPIEIIQSGPILYFTHSLTHEIQQALTTKYFKLSPFHELIDRVIISGKDGITYQYFEANYH